MRIELAMLLSVAVVAVAPLAAQQEGPARTRKPAARSRIEQKCRDLIAAVQPDRLPAASDEQLYAWASEVRECIEHASPKTRVDVLAVHETLVWYALKQDSEQKREEQEKNHKLDLKVCTDFIEWSSDRQKAHTETLNNLIDRYNGLRAYTRSLEKMSEQILEAAQRALDLVGNRTPVFFPCERPARPVYINLPPPKPLHCSHATAKVPLNLLALLPGRLALGPARALD